MRRDPYWSGRLDRWALWVYTAPGGARAAYYLERVDCAVQFGAPTPAINDEAVVTDQLVAALPPPLKAAVKGLYLDGIGNSKEGIARRLGVSQSTLHLRLCHADVRLEIALQARHEAARHAGQAAGMLRA